MICLSERNMTKNTWKSLDVVVLGGGLGGLSCAIAMRRAGHRVRIYERYDYAGEVGASLSCASNGGRWLHEWGVDPFKARPIILKRLIKHNWSNGDVTGVYDLGDYKAKFGYPYFNFHRIDIHKTLKDTATSLEGLGDACHLFTNHKAIKVDPETGHIVFENGEEADAELIIAADGIRSLTKPQLDIEPRFRNSDLSCVRVLLNAKDAKQLGFNDYSANEAIEFWGETKYKIVLSPCSDGEIISCYCFYEASAEDKRDGWHNEIPVEKLLERIEGLDPTLRKLFKECGYDIKQWRLYVHEALPHFFKVSSDGSHGIALMGDAAHPMMPDQSQGAVSAFEDSGSLGYIFSRRFNLTIEEGLKIYEVERKPRVTKIQNASLRARENLNERIGWSSGLNKDENKLTIEEVCGYDMKAHINEVIREYIPDK